MSAQSFALAAAVVLQCVICTQAHLPFVPRGAMKWTTVLTVPGAIFTSATDIPNGLMFSTQDGRIYRRTASGTLLWADLRDMVDSTGERGLSAIAFDGLRVYALLVNKEPHIVLWSLSITDPHNRSQLWDAGIVAGQRHAAGGMVWHDGALFIGIGDQAPDNDALRLAALNDGSFIGKVLHVQPNTRAVQVYARGFRMPWALAWQHGALHVADVGELRFEELNRVVQGGTYGWPCYEAYEPRQYAPDVCGAFTHLPPVLAYGRDAGRAIVGIGNGVVIDFDGAVMNDATGAVVNRVPNAPVSAAFWSARGLYAMTFENGVGRVHLYQ